MKLLSKTLPLAFLALASCQTAHDVAVASFKVADAPANYIRRQIDAEEQPQTITTTTTTTGATAATSETTTNGTITGYPQTRQQMVVNRSTQPVATGPRPEPTPERVVAKQRHAATAPSPRPSPNAATSTSRSIHHETTATQARPNATPTRNTTAQSPSSDIPYAKPVPGKPGYVFSPYDPSGGYVDVTGYTPGSKVKDPYSQKIFLVP